MKDCLLNRDRLFNHPVSHWPSQEDNPPSKWLEGVIQRRLLGYRHCSLFVFGDLAVVDPANFWTKQNVSQLKYKRVELPTTLYMQHNSDLGKSQTLSMSSINVAIILKAR